MVAAARHRDLPLGRVAGFRALPGRGACGSVTCGEETRAVWAGADEWLVSEGFAGAEGLPMPLSAATTLCVAWDGAVRARVSLADSLRPEAASAVAALRQAGLAVTVLSGDRRASAERLARELEVEVRAQLSPDQKLEEVRAAQKRGEVVAVVGDGINDAPALAQADVGLAMGSGTDLAREVGQVALLGDHLSRLPWLLALARRTRHTIRINLWWAFGYNVLTLCAAFCGLLHPLLAALAMLGSSLFVLHNSLARPT